MAGRKGVVNSCGAERSGCVCTLWGWEVRVWVHQLWGLRGRRGGCTLGGWELKGLENLVGDGCTIWGFEA